MASRSCNATGNSLWEPGQNPLHKLLNRLDVVAIARHRYHHMSFLIAHLETPDMMSKRRQIQDEFCDLLKRFNDSGDMAPSDLIARIANDAIARFISIDRQLIYDVRVWLTYATSPIALDYPKPVCPFQSDAGEIEANREQRAEYEEASNFLTLYQQIRERLCRQIAELGQTIPVCIAQRGRIAYDLFRGTIESPEQQAAQHALLAMLDAERAAVVGGSSIPTVKANQDIETKKHGRKPIDPEGTQRIADAWKTGRYNYYAELAKVLGRKTREVKDALERHRKKQTRQKSVKRS